MKLLIADKFDPVGIERLNALGCELKSDPGLDAGALPQAIAAEKPDVLIVRSTKVSAQAIAAAERLTLIVRAGAGYDTIDIPAASKAGVFVANCPGKNAIAVAELAWGLILSCDRRIPDQTADLRAGRWNKKEYGRARGLYGRTLGIVGLGTIGVEVARRGRAFGMRVLAWSRSLTDERAAELGVARAGSLLQVAAESDVVSVHVASTPETRHIVGAEFIAAMRPGATLVNTARGQVVDADALRRGIADKRLRAGLDVYAREPGSATGAFEDPVAQQPGVYGTHHVGASTDQAQQAIALEAVRLVEHYLATGTVENCVNRAHRSAATCMLTVRHENRPGVLARVFQVIGEAGINVEEMENLLYEGAEAACARIQLAGVPTAAHLDKMRALASEIMSLELSRIGGAQEENSP